MQTPALALECCLSLVTSSDSTPQKVDESLEMPGPEPKGYISFGKEIMLARLKGGIFIMANSQMVIVVAGAQGHLGKLLCDALIPVDDVIRKAFEHSSSAGTENGKGRL
jgi:hypothetical protein